MGAPCSTSQACINYGNSSAVLHVSHNSATATTLGCLSQGLTPGQVLTVMIDNTGTAGLTFSSPGTCPAGFAPLSYNSNAAPSGISGGGTATLQVIFYSGKWRLVSIN